MRTTAALLLALALAPACGDEGGGDTDPTGVRGCPGNANIAPDSAKDLAAGDSATGYVCPVGNQHWFRIQVPDGQPVVSVDLHNDTPLSAVKLSYTLRAADGMTPVDQTPPPTMTSGKQQLRFAHCVPKGGAYYLQVQSFGNDAADARNPFTLSYTTAPDPDGGEPGNGGAAGAVAATGADQRGFVACKGDRDFYKITVGADALLDVSLTTAAATPGLNLKYSVLDDQMGVVAEDAVATGATPTSLRAVLTTPRAGAYYLVVADQGAGSDLKTPYTIKVSPLTEPDANDRTTRNDTPDTATALGSWTCGGGASFGKVAYLASRADNDWYKITLSGVGPACPAILDVSASWGGGGATVRPQISLVYPDAPSGAYPGSPCAKDEECRFLRQACGSDDNRCQYLGNQCDKQMGRCTGAAVCLPEKQCGVLQFAKQQTATGGAAGVRTAQPLVAAGTYYIRVRDFQGTGYDAGASYSLAVRLSPDDREPNNFYSPYSLPDNGLVRNATFIAQNKIALDQTITSRVGYERDQDFYVLDHPCPGQDCTLSITYSTSQASRVYHTFQVEGDGRTVAGFPAAPAMRTTAPKIDNAVFGDGVSTCFYASKGITGPYYIWVSDLLKGGPLWDQDTTYTFAVHKVQDGCSALCAQAPYNCGK